jgi:hypothetical protein
MSTWAAGLRMPLPIEVFEANSGSFVGPVPSCSVSVPPGFKVLSGGGYVIGVPVDWSTRDSAGFAIVDSYPITAQQGGVPTGWIVTAANTQDSAPNIQGVIVGVVVLALYDPYDLFNVQVWSSPSPAKVPDGYCLTGGGASASSGFLQGTYPDQSCGSWNVAYGNPGNSAPSDATAYAIGLSSKTGIGISVSTASLISEEESTTPFYNPGTVTVGPFLVGGGAQISQSSASPGAFLTQSYYLFTSEWGPCFNVRGFSPVNTQCTVWPIQLQLTSTSACPMLRILPANGLLPPVAGPEITQSFRITGGSGSYSVTGATSTTPSVPGMELPSGLQLNAPVGGVVTLTGQADQPGAPPVPYPYNVFIHFVVTDTVTKTSSRGIYYLPVRPAAAGGSAS